jgi:hypothetical protein
MNEAARSQSESARRSVTEAYRAQLRLLRERVESYWKSRAAAIAEDSGAGTATEFARIVTSGLCDSVILLDDKGAVTYPVEVPSLPVADSRVQDPDWKPPTPGASSRSPTPTLRPPLAPRRRRSAAWFVAGGARRRSGPSSSGLRREPRLAVWISRGDLLPPTNNYSRCA